MNIEYVFVWNDVMQSMCETDRCYPLIWIGSYNHRFLFMHNMYDVLSSFLVYDASLLDFYRGATRCCLHGLEYKG